MGANFRADRLEEAIHSYGLDLDENIKWDNEKMIKALGDYFISLSPEEYSWGSRYVQSLSTPMLCRHLKEDIKNFKISPVESTDYVAENKVNGFRTICSYSPEVGFEFFSRRESSSDYLNGNFTNKFLFINNGLISEPKDYKGSFNYRFVIDGELIVENSEEESNTMGVSIEDYIQGILGSSPERAQAFQKDGHRLKMIVFDVLYFEKNPTIPAEWEPKYDYKDYELKQEDIEWVNKHFSAYLESAGFKSYGRAKKLYQFLFSLKKSHVNDMRRFPFIKRRELREKIVKFLNKKNLPFYEVEYEDVFKTAFTDTILREGGEGCFKGSVLVNMADGSMKQIRDINEGDLVLSYNIETKKIETKEVMRKINNGRKNISNYISLSHGILQSDRTPNKQNRHRRIICTKNHHFYNGSDYEPIELMNNCYELNYIFDEYRYQALLGWLFCDGYIHKDAQITLSQKDSDFMKYTEKMFEKFSKGGSKSFISGKGSKMCKINIDKDYCTPFKEFKNDPIKYIHQMNEIAFAYLFMGDGSKNKTGMDIATHSLSLEIIEELMKQLQKYTGTLQYTLRKDKRVKDLGYYVYIYAGSVKRIASVIGKYVHPSLRYKFPIQLNDFEPVPDVSKDIKKVNVYKTELKCYTNYKDNSTLTSWDLEIKDNHNYFVENVLVHNSILKNIHAPYISGMRSSRSHRAAMKVKQSIANMLSGDETLVEDFDVFITGANPPKSDRITGMIGSLSCSVYIKDTDGNVKEHEIANVSGISHEWKRKLAEIDLNTGKIGLNPAYKDKVISINGLALTATNLKFQHATLKNNGKIEFKAKNPTECTWDEVVLKEMALIRGK